MEQKKLINQPELMQFIKSVLPKEFLGTGGKNGTKFIRHARLKYPITKNMIFTKLVSNHSIRNGLNQTKLIQNIKKTILQ